MVVSARLVLSHPVCVCVCVCVCECVFPPHWHVPFCRRLLAMLSGPTGLWHLPLYQFLVQLQLPEPFRNTPQLCPLSNQLVFPHSAAESVLELPDHSQSGMHLIQILQVSRSGGGRRVIRDHGNSALGGSSSGSSSDPGSQTQMKKIDALGHFFSFAGFFLHWAGTGIKHCMHSGRRQGVITCMCACPCEGGRTRMNVFVCVGLGWVGGVHASYIHSLFAQSLT